MSVLLVSFFHIRSRFVFSNFCVLDSRCGVKRLQEKESIFFVVLPKRHHRLQVNNKNARMRSKTGRNVPKPRTLGVIVARFRGLFPISIAIASGVRPARKREIVRMQRQNKKPKFKRQGSARGAGKESKTKSGKSKGSVVPKTKRSIKMKKNSRITCESAQKTTLDWCLKWPSR
jgi:hypothetical protein